MGCPSSTLDTRNCKSSLCCQRPFNVEGPLLSEALCCQRPFIVKSPFLSKALCCQRPFLIRGLLLSKVTARWQRQSPAPMGSLVESGAAEGAHPSVTPSSGTGYTPAPAVMHSVQCCLFYPAVMHSVQCYLFCLANPWSAGEYPREPEKGYDMHSHTCAIILINAVL